MFGVRVPPLECGWETGGPPTPETSFKRRSRYSGYSGAEGRTELGQRLSRIGNDDIAVTINYFD